MKTKRLFGTAEDVAQAGPGGPVPTATQIQGASAEAAAQSLPGFDEYQFGTQGPVPSGAGVSVPTRLDAPFFEGDVSVPRPVATTTAPATGAGALVPKGAVAPQVAESTFLGRTGDFLKDPSLSGFGNIFYDASAKTTLGKLAPGLTTAGLAYLASGDPFEEPETEVPNIQQDYFKDVMAARERVRGEYPSFFGSLAPASYPTQTVQNIYTPPTDYTTRSNIPIRTYQAAKGSGPEGVEDFPRKTGPISGPGTGTSDDIPAMLSDGEFVFTAKAVRNMGGGSRRKGAAKMYKLMKMLEGGPVDKTARA
jgi:hypothetical protein